MNIRTAKLTFYHITVNSTCYAIKNPKSFNTSYITFDDKDLEAARELLLKEQK
jgi:hypothetical protein